MTLFRCSVLLLLLIAPLHAVPQTSDSYLCIPDLSTGFKYKDGEWQTVRFNVAEEKYVLRKRKRKRKEKHPIYSDSKWLIFRFGETTPAGGCDKGFDSSGLIACSYYLYGDFRMNRGTGRYQAIYWPGYVDSQSADAANLDPEAQRDGEDTPSMTIGRCSAI